MQKARILIAVEPAALLQAIRHLFRHRPEFRIEAAQSRTAVLARRASRLHPEVIIVNLRLLGGHAGILIRELKLASPDSKLIVTGFLGGFQKHARKCGADAYLEEEHLVKRLLPTVQKLLSPRRPGLGKASPANPLTTPAGSFSARLVKTAVFADFRQSLGS